MLIVPCPTCGCPVTLHENFSDSVCPQCGQVVHCPAETAPLAVSSAHAPGETFPEEAPPLSSEPPASTAASTTSSLPPDKENIPSQETTPPSPPAPKHAAPRQKPAAPTKVPSTPRAAKTAMPSTSQATELMPGPAEVPITCPRCQYTWSVPSEQQYNLTCPNCNGVFAHRPPTQSPFNLSSPPTTLSPPSPAENKSQTIIPVPPEVSIPPPGMPPPSPAPPSSAPTIDLPPPPPPTGVPPPPPPKLPVPSSKKSPHPTSRLVKSGPPPRSPRHRLLGVLLALLPCVLLLGVGAWLWHALYTSSFL